MWWMYSRALSMPSKIYAMVSSAMPSVKCVQIRSLADPERPSNTYNLDEKAVLYYITTGCFQMLLTYFYYV